MTLSADINNLEHLKTPDILLKLSLLIRLGVAVMLSSCSYRPFPSLASLENDQTFSVEYISVGCFHNYSEILLFSSSSVGITRVDTGVSEGAVEQAGDTKTFLGSVPLSAEDVKGVDALFAFYSSGPSMGCTTVDRIPVTYMEGDRIIETYAFSDGSCSTNEMESLLTFGELRLRLKPESKEGFEF